MRWGSFINRLALRRRPFARTIFLFVFSLALVLSAIPITRGPASAEFQNSETGSRASTVAETDHSAQPHPCNRGPMPAPFGSCAISSFSAGLLAVVVVHPRPLPPGEPVARLAAGSASAIVMSDPDV
jgi:hypothetical protein